MKIYAIYFDNGETWDDNRNYILKDEIYLSRLSAELRRDALEEDCKKIRENKDSDHYYNLSVTPTWEVKEFFVKE